VVYFIIIVFCKILLKAVNAICNFGKYIINLVIIPINAPYCQKNTMELQVVYQPWKKGVDG